jgi:hypothetical protein
MLGLTRENLSQNALGIGVGLGCIVGGWTVPTLLAPADDALLAEAATSKPVGGMEAATLQGMDTNVTAVIASVSTRGSLSQYLLTLRTLSSVSRFDQWSFLLTTVLLLLLGRLLWQWFARPFEYVRGYEKDKRLEAAYLRLAGAIPPGYPNTW